MRKILFLFLLFSLFQAFPASATHIVGGEIYYKYLGNNNYEIHLRVYRDCKFGVPPFDYPASVGIFNSSNQLVYNLLMYDVDSATIPSIINNPCFIPPTNICYRVADYKDTINLPPTPGGYQLAYQRCCRNQTILNIVNPLNTGITIYATIPGNIPDNSNPVYDTLPPPFVCLGYPLIFDHSATDPDGDSLVYELCTPYDGADQTFPQPQPPYNPPYNNVLFQPPFSLFDLLGGVPMAIDAQTGLLTATPNTQGQFVIGVCVNEYRNGVFLSKTRRDYQLNVVPCPSLIVCALAAPSITCGSLTIPFTNHSFGAGSYLWDFGDPNSTTDTSTALNPTYTYSDTGTFTIRLIAYSFFNPLCADTNEITIQVLPEYVLDYIYVPTPCSYEVAFFDSSNTDSGPTVTWDWNFGDGTIANTPDPIHTFPGPGTYNVTLHGVSARGCEQTVVKQIVLLPFLDTQTSTQSASCHDTCDAAATVNVSFGTAPFSYQWNDPASQTTNTATNLCAGTYEVVVTDSLGCTDTVTVNVNQPDPLQSIASSTDAYCNGACIGTASVNLSGGTGPFSITWNDPSGQTTATAVQLCPGTYTAIITDFNGCITSDSVEVIFSNYIPPLDAVASDTTIFQGQTINLTALTSGGPYNYQWVPEDLVNNPISQNTTSSPDEPSWYIVTIADSNGCENIDSVFVNVRKVTCIEPELFIPNAFTPDNDGKNDILYVRGNTIRELTFKVFNRWGELVFETSNPKIGWDGTYKGAKAAPAVYTYWVEATCYNEEKFFKKGNITLIR